MKLVGTDDISSLGNDVRQRGQHIMDAIFLFDSILFSIHCLQNVCKHEMVFGSVNKSPQIEQAISSSICCHSFPSLGSESLLAVFMFSCENQYCTRQEYIQGVSKWSLHVQGINYRVSMQFLIERFSANHRRLLGADGLQR